MAAGAASTIQPIEGQHAVAWAQVLELPTNEWLPNFQSDSDALDPQQYATS